MLVLAQYPSLFPMMFSVRYCRTCMCPFFGPIFLTKRFIACFVLEIKF